MGRYGSPEGRGETPKIAIGGTMAAVPGVSMQCASPAGELSVSAQHGANQSQAERPKAEEGTGERAFVILFHLDFDEPDRHSGYRLLTASLAR